MKDSKFKSFEKRFAKNGVRLIIFHIFTPTSERIFWCASQAPYNLQVSLRAFDDSTWNLSQQFEVSTVFDTRLFQHEDLFFNISIFRIKTSEISSSRIESWYLSSEYIL